MSTTIGSSEYGLCMDGLSLLMSLVSFVYQSGKGSDSADCEKTDYRVSERVFIHKFSEVILGLIK